MIAYKGFDKDLKCRGFQYEIGKTYVEPEAELCNCGFHACKYPLDVFKYYPPSSSRYCIVELDDVTESSGEDDSKCCGKKITIKKEIGVNGMIEEAVSQTKRDIVTSNDIGNCSVATNTGHWSAATNTGHWSAATNTGHWSAATTTGDRSAATNTGVQSVATNTGYWSAATTTGIRSAATNTGYWSAATNTGDQSAATNTGVQSVATNTGYWSAATNTGDQSAATNTGVQSVATNTGVQSAATNTGDWSVATNTGIRSTATVSGKESIAIVTGYQGKAAGDIGCWLVLTERDNDGHILGMQTVMVDGKRIKPDVYYTLSGGKVVEA